MSYFQKKVKQQCLYQSTHQQLWNWSLIFIHTVFLDEPHSIPKHPSSRRLLRNKSKRRLAFDSIGNESWLAYSNPQSSSWYQYGQALCEARALGLSSEWTELPPWIMWKIVETPKLRRSTDSHRIWVVKDFQISIAIFLVPGNGHHRHFDLLLCT